ncbi:MAG: hypothetical protein KDJ16_05515, partial [Hyphomicrobiales bacterium]|nr:hypothetical protein [Hyphomicrobiales bacterium]
FPVTMKPPRGTWLGGMFAVALLALIGFALFALALLIAIGGGNIGAALVPAAVSGVFGVLTRYVLGDAMAKRGWRMAIGADAVELDLPRKRSLTHHLDAVRTKIRFDEIDAIETRLEAYRSLGMANMNRVFALRPKSGEIVILGEDRALGTNLETDFLARAVERLRQIGDLPLRDLGMAEGKGGILAMLYTRPPPWEASGISAERQQALWRRAAWTGILAGLGVIFVLAAVAIRHLL